MKGCFVQDSKDLLSPPVALSFLSPLSLLGCVGHGGPPDFLSHPHRGAPNVRVDLQSVQILAEVFIASCPPAEGLFDEHSVATNARCHM